MSQEPRAIDVGDAKSFYKAQVYCRNCRHDGEMEILFGKQVHMGTCTICGCNTLQAADESREKPPLVTLNFDQCDWAGDSDDLHKFKMHRLNSWNTGQQSIYSQAQRDRDRGGHARTLLDTASGSLGKFNDEMLKSLGIPEHLMKESNANFSAVGIAAMMTPPERENSRQQIARDILDQPFEP